MNPIYKFEINRPNANLLDLNKLVPGLLDIDNGNVTENKSYKTSDWMPVTPGTNYKYCRRSDFVEYVPWACFYTSTKEFISGGYGISQTPANAAYLRVSDNGIEGFGVFPESATSFSEYVSPQVFPLYKDDLAKEIELQTNEQFYREKLSGKLTFIGPDYRFINGQAFDFKFLLKLFISYDAGNTWAVYWNGKFWKTNCTFNLEDESVTVTPEPVDKYDDVLAGMEKEFDLIELAPEIVPVNLDKRPMIQVYVPGQTVIGCFLSGMWWEQECKSVTNHNELIYDYYFAKNKTMRAAEVSGTTSPQLPSIFSKINPISNTDTLAGGNYIIEIEDYSLEPETQGGSWSIKDSQGTVLWFYKSAAVFPELPYSVTLQPQNGASGTVTLYIHDIDVYARYVCDVLSAHGVDTYEIPGNDIVSNNRNYKRVTRYNFPETIGFGTQFSTTPTQWGIYQPGMYYKSPASILIPNWYPVARNAWGRVSIWFSPSAIDDIDEQSWRKTSTLRHTYPIASVISVLLGKIAPGITHQETTAYSQFLYGLNPLMGINQRLFITPKSNMVSLGYDQPAQKAPITLKSVMNMLRDCFRCYWYIDNDNRFRIEHVEFFRRGGSYYELPQVGRNLINEKVKRNGKPWAFGTTQYEFDKPNMPARYQFGWMDDVTKPFIGPPIDIISQYVNPDNIEQIDVSNFTSDVDYILLNPDDISKDGFVLLSAILSNGVYKLPYMQFNIDGTTFVLQNAYVAFIYLQQYYFWDMPAKYFRYNGEQRTAFGIKKLKVQQLNFPAIEDPDTLKLIKTYLGDGTIQKMSLNLSSRNANTTLRYDTEQ